MNFCLNTICQKKSFKQRLWHFSYMFHYIFFVLSILQCSVFVVISDYRLVWTVWCSVLIWYELNTLQTWNQEVIINWNSCSRESTHFVLKNRCVSLFSDFNIYQLHMVTSRSKVRCDHIYEVKFLSTVPDQRCSLPCLAAHLHGCHGIHCPRPAYHPAGPEHLITTARTLHMMALTDNSDSWL